MADDSKGLNALEEILERSGEEVPEEILELDAFIEGSPLFSSLSAEDRKSLARKAKFKEVGGGDTVMAEGTRGETFCIVKRGTVVVDATFEGKTKRLATLGPGAIIGEVAVLMGTPRTATVIADGDVELFEFHGDDVRPILDQNKELKRQLQGLIEQRTDQTIAVFLGRPGDDGE